MDRSKRLNQLPKNTPGVIRCVLDAHDADAIAKRLRDLGFVEGERVSVVARAPWGSDPLLVRIGSTRFALRAAEANRIEVQLQEEV